jgi:hypothetical protein
LAGFRVDEVFSTRFEEIEAAYRRGDAVDLLKALDVLLQRLVDIVGNAFVVLLIFARDEVERDSANFSKPHSSIKVDGAMVGVGDMKPGDEAFATMISR